MIKRKVLLPIVIVVVVLAIFTSLMVFQSRPKAQLKAPLALPVMVKRLKLGRHIPSVLLYGEVDSSQHTVLKSLLDTTVSQVVVRDGLRVTKDQVLLKLDDTMIGLRLQEAQAVITETEARVAQYQAKYRREQQAMKHEQQLIRIQQRSLQRQQTLRARQVVSEQTLDKEKAILSKQQLLYNDRAKVVELDQHKVVQLQALLQRHDAAYQRIKKRVQSAVVRAPYNGIVTVVFVAMGGHVVPGQKLVKLLGTDELEVRALIPNPYLRHVVSALARNKPLPALAKVDGQSIKLKLTRLAAAVQPGQIGRDGIFEVSHYSMSLAHKRMLPIQLRLGAVAKSFLIPEQALYGNDKVYRVVGDRLQSCVVRVMGREHLLHQSLRLIVVSSALKDKDVIVITQLPNAINGLLVKPRFEE